MPYSSFIFCPVLEEKPAVGRPKRDRSKVKAGRKAARRR